MGEDKKREGIGDKRGEQRDEVETQGKRGKEIKEGRGRERREKR